MANMAIDHLPILEIGKEASAAVAGAPFTFTLTVTNTDPVANATGVVITDAVPMGAHYISGGSYTGGVVTWSELTVPVNSKTETTFVVTACHTITNSLYRVIASTQGVKPSWGVPLAVTPSAPTINAAFDLIPKQVDVNQSIIFADASDTNGSSIVACEWDFGDEETGSGSVVSHTYTTAGVYTVTLTVMDACGYTNTAWMRNVVQAMPIEPFYPVFLPLVVRDHP
jgi:uncharacterized repeat protein (TIGR01451 family)